MALGPGCSAVTQGGGRSARPARGRHQRQQHAQRLQRLADGHLRVHCSSCRAVGAAHHIAACRWGCGAAATLRWGMPHTASQQRCQCRQVLLLQQLQQLRRRSSHSAYCRGQGAAWDNGRMPLLACCL